jgi:hypothetical protein
MGYHIRNSEPEGQFVEAWTKWHLPYNGNRSFRRDPVYAEYLTGLQSAINRMLHHSTSSLCASYTYAGSNEGDPDLDNILLYNVRPPIFGENIHFLSLTRIDTQVPDPPEQFDFAPLAHVRYGIAGQDLAFDNLRAIAQAGPVNCEKKDLPHAGRLWRLLKPTTRCLEAGRWKKGTPFSIRLTVSAPDDMRFKLTVLAKPLIDGFCSAFHFRADVNEQLLIRLCQKYRWEMNEVATLFEPKHSKNAVLGEWQTPTDMCRWAPADKYLIGCVIKREQSDRLSISGQLFC